MKKQLSLALAAAFSLSVAGTSLAAPTNPFIDVPVSHWAYDALAQLQKDGILNGDGTFSGDRSLTRYEIAAIVAKITDHDGKNAPLIRKLKSEFASELYNLGVRVDALEKNASTIKFSGDAKLAYETGMIIGSGQSRARNQHGNSSHFRQEINLGLEADIADNLNFYGVITVENISNAYQTKKGYNDTYKTSEGGDMAYVLAEFRWANKNFTASIGRLNPFLGQGLIWGGDNPADGILLGYNFGRVNLEAGYLDLTPTAGIDPSINAFAANLGVKVNNRINLTAAYLDAVNPGNLANFLQEEYDFIFPPGYAYRQWAVGADIKFGNDFKLVGEYVRNAGAPSHISPIYQGTTLEYPSPQRNGWWGRLQWKEIDENNPGTYSFYADYIKLGNWAVDSTIFGHDLNIAGGNGIGGDGAKGWGLGLQYVFAKNADIELNYYNLKSYKGNFDYKNSYSITTNFYF